MVVKMLVQCIKEVNLDVHTLYKLCTHSHNKNKHVIITYLQCI